MQSSLFMHTAFISYEYPPDTAVDGIAPSVKLAVSMSASRGHDVEVSTAGKRRSGRNMAWRRESVL